MAEDKPKAEAKAEAKPKAEAKVDLTRQPTSRMINHGKLSLALCTSPRARYLTIFFDSTRRFQTLMGSS